MKRLILILLLYSTYSYAVDFDGPVFNVSLRHQF